MQNDPELSGKYLGTISKDFVKVAETIKEAMYAVRKREFSKYPIMVICKEEQPIGQLLLPREKLELEWNYSLSFLEEFEQRGLIEKEKREAFVAIYKDPDEFACIFVVDKEFTNYVYIPYPID